jgi:5'-nucleotidase
LVDVIAAGHSHAGLAHQVNGIAIIEPFARGLAFGRVDVVVDSRTRSVARMRLFAPREICAQADPITERCVPTTESAAPAQYEGRAVKPDPAVIEAMAPALERIRALQAATLGVSLGAPIRRLGDLGSPLGNLFADALRDAVPGADVAIVSNATGGLRADLPEGPITFGRLYDVFPFDNRTAQMTLSGAELSRWMAAEIQQGRRGTLGTSGVGVRASCLGDGIHVELFRSSGLPIHDDDRLVVVTIGSPTLSGTVLSVAPPGGASAFDNAPVVREAVEDWLRQHGGHTGANEVVGADVHRWEYLDPESIGCIVSDGYGPPFLR